MLVLLGQLESRQTLFVLRLQIRACRDQLFQHGEIAEVNRGGVQQWIKVEVKTSDVRRIIFQQRDYAESQKLW